MKEYDLVVVGSGAGLSVVENALRHGLTVGLIDRGPLGGTCLNVGCIPSKILIYPADRIMEIRESKKLGIHAEIRDVDFRAVMERMQKTVREGERHIREGITHSEGLDFYEGEGRFVKDHTLEVGKERVRGRKIVIASGARPHIPPLRGVDAVELLTNETVLRLDSRPESIVIVGGGYVAAEYAHFFDSMGVKVTLVQKNPRLLPEEEPEISALIRKEMERRVQIYTNTEATAVRKLSAGISVSARDNATGRPLIFEAEKIMAAAGRRSNADIIEVDKTGVETDRRGYIKVNKYFETTAKNIWAFGDAIGKKMFRHVANKEASVVWQNVIHDSKVSIDYRAAPHAVFTYPEIASVGMTEEQALKDYHPRDILVGRAGYSDVARGEAMMEGEAFAKAIVRKDTKQILGFHIIGPHASILIQEVVNAMANNGDIWSIGKGMHIHPALSEVVVATLGNLEELAPSPPLSR
jgi:mycothione reductase